MKKMKVKKERRGSGATTAEVLRRTVFLGFVLGILFFAVLIAKQFKVQLVDYAFYQSKAVSQQTKSEIIAAERGKITDVNGEELAVSVMSETVIMVPSKIDKESDEGKEQARLIAESLSNILGIPYETVWEKTQKTNDYEYVVRKIDTETADKVRAFIQDNKLSAQLYLISESKRYYPKGSVASAIVGFCGTDNAGLYGIEQYFNSELNGVEGRVIAAHNGVGVDMDAAYEQYTAAQNGDTIELTIDTVIQGYLQQYLESARQNSDATSVTGVVMEVKTGRILAAGTAPTFDLNDPYAILDEAFLESIAEMTEEEQAEEKREYRNELWRNRLVNYTYEPGSVFKIITGAMAVEENLVASGETFFCDGVVELSEAEVHCWQHSGHGAQTFTEGVMHSCNMVFVELGQRLGARNFFKYFQAFGLTEKTGITLPGESGGSKSLYHNETALQIDVQLGNSSFGQTFKVTPIQIISAVSAVANGGTLYRPQIVNRILDSEGNVKQTFEPEVVRQVVSESTSERMNDALYMVVNGSGGTGRNAYVRGYRVAGKTGTSQKMDQLNEEGVADMYVVSFLGYAPADDPEIAVLVLIDEPKKGTISGGAAAAPVVANILRDSLTYLNVEPVYTEEEYAVLDIVMPDFTGMTAAEAKERAAQEGLTVMVRGTGDTITAQSPEAGVTVPRDNVLNLYAGGDKPATTYNCPNLKGMTLSAIKNAIDGSGLYVRPIGLADYGSTIQCVSQTPEAGEQIPFGTVITVNFQDTGAIE